MAAIDDVNRILREFKRYTGDGLPNEPTGAPLPIGDPQSGVQNPKKSELRTALLAVLTAPTEDAARAEEAAQLAEQYAGSWEALSEAVDEAEAARDAALAVAGPLSTQPQGRLSLMSGVPVSGSDVTGATSIYYVPSGGSYAPIYDGSTFVGRGIGDQLTHALDSNTGHTLYQAADKNYDEWLIWDSSGNVVRLGNGPDWAAGAVAGSSAVDAGARGTGAGSSELEVFQGVIVNKNEMTVRWGSGSGDMLVVPARCATYVGTIRPTANGQATDTREKRLVFNAYNRELRNLRRQDPASSWTYSTDAWRQANGNADNKVQVLLGLAGVVVEVDLLVAVTTNGVTPRVVIASIGVNGQNLPEDTVNALLTVTIAQTSGTARYRGQPGLGLREIKWLEFGGANDTQTWLGTPSYIKTGLTGAFMG